MVEPQHMKTGKLFEFKVEELGAALQTALAAEAIQDFDGQTEAVCSGCRAKTPRLYVVAEMKHLALRAINRKKQGICGNCIAELITKQGWNIVSSGDRF